MIIGGRRKVPVDRHDHRQPLPGAGLAQGAGCPSLNPASASLLPSLPHLPVWYALLVCSKTAGRLRLFGRRGRPSLLHFTVSSTFRSPLLCCSAPIRPTLVGGAREAPPPPPDRTLPVRAVSPKTPPPPSGFSSTFRSPLLLCSITVGRRPSGSATSVRVDTAVLWLTCLWDQRDDRLWLTYLWDQRDDHPCLTYLSETERDQ